MHLESMRISTRLYILSGLAIAALIIQLAISGSGFSRLGILQDEGYRRAADSAEIQDISHIGEKLYLVIADSVINRDLEHSASEWNSEKASALKDIARAAVLADTPEEHRSVENAKRSLEELIMLYETQMIPQLQQDTQQTDAISAIRQIDGSIDAHVATIRQSMQPLRESLNNEAHEADVAFDTTQASIISTSMAISVATLVILIWFAWLIIASIFRQLGGEPAQVVEITRRIADGDLSTPIQVSKKHSGSVLDAMKTMQSRLSELIHGIHESAASMSSSAEQLAAVSQQTYASSGQQSSATSSIAAAMEQLTISIEMVAHNAKTAESIALQSGNTSQIGEQHVTNAVEEMRSISSAVQATANEMARLKEHAMRIGNVMSVIGEVAEQTNLLALNAAIEAARAGESGRGFAVVADEVRKLAERTANSAKEISCMVESIQKYSSEAALSMEKSSTQASKGVEVANHAGDSIKTIRSGSTEVLGTISEISHALTEQKSASTEIARNLEVIARMTDEHATAVSEVASTAGHLKSLAGQLRQSVSGFRLATTS